MRVPQRVRASSAWYPVSPKLLFALNLGDQLVGRTGFCIHPKAGVRTVPKLGGTKDVNIEALLALKPTHVIVNIDENTQALFDELTAHVDHIIVTHPNAPEDNLALYAFAGWDLFASNRS